ncbi:MAG: lamin tail domain-containing protein [Thermoflexales bacterium]|nr:lamin tail domain-containing protein [Thermoflexales bacterium]
METRHLGVAVGGLAAGAALAVSLLLVPAMRLAGAEGDITYSTVDNFDRANSNTLGTSSSGHSTWLEHEPPGEEDQLAISNTVLLATTSGVSGYEPTNASLDLTAEQASFDLGATDAGWAFHFDLNRNPSGWAATYYSLGWVLAANEADFASDTVDGYAVLWTGTGDELVLTRFANGIAGTNPGTAVITTGLDWDAAPAAGVNVRAEVSAGGEWTLYWEEGEGLAAPLDIDAHSASGSSTVYFDDATMSYSGPIWGHYTSTDTTSSGTFDNFAFGITPETGGVSLAKQVSQAANIPYHDAVTYTVNLRNGGAVDEANAHFTDTLPAEVDFAAWLSRPAGASRAGDVIAWSGTLTAGAAITFSWVVSHVGDYGETVINTAQYSGTSLVSDTASFSVEQDVQPGLVINEIDYDQPGTDTAEFAEIKNTSVQTLNLDIYALEFVNGLDTSVYRTIDLPDVDLAPGGYYVVCADAASVANCDLDVSPDSNLIQNGAPDAVALVAGGAVVDAVSYEGDTGAPYTEGSGVGLQDDDSAGAGLSRFPDGIDSGQNNLDLSRRCITPGQANAAAGEHCVLYVSQLSGEWSAASTWGGGGVPGPDDRVTILAGTRVTVSAAAACYQLQVESGGVLAIVESGSLEVSGDLENGGRLEQTRVVTGGAEVAFLDTGGYGGLSIDAGGLDLGRTRVSVEGGRDCTAVAGEAVRRCFEIVPITATGRSATVTVFFDSGEIPPPNTCDTLELFHWNDGWGAALARDNSYGDEGRLCGGDPQSLRAVGVSDFSAFVLKSAVPTAARLRGLRAVARPYLGWAAGLLALAAGLAAARRRRRMGVHSPLR